MKYYKKNLLLISWLSIYCGQFVYSQALPPLLTIDELLERVVASANPSYQARMQSVTAAQAHLKAIKSEALPRLNLHGQISYATSNTIRGSYFQYRGAVIPTSGVTPGNIMQPAWGDIVSGNFEWDFFSFGQQKIHESIAALQVSGAKNDLALFELEKKCGAVHAFLTVLLQESRARISNATRQRTEALALRVRALVESGIRPGVDTALLAAEFARIETAQLQAALAVTVARQELAMWAGDSSYANRLLDTFPFLKTTPKTVALSAISIEKHPTLQQAATRLAIALKQVKQLSYSYLPRITLLGGAWARGSGISFDVNVRTQGLAGLAFSRYNYAIGVASSFQILDWQRIYHRSQSAKAEAETRRLMLSDIEFQLKTRLQSAQEQLAAYTKIAQFGAVGIRAAETAYLQAAARYQAGLSPLAELAQSLLALEKAEIEDATAHLAAWQSLILLAAAAGDIMVFKDAL